MYAFICTSVPMCVYKILRKSWPYTYMSFDIKFARQKCHGVCFYKSCTDIISKQFKMIDEFITINSPTVVNICLSVQVSHHQSGNQ